MQHEQISTFPKDYKNKDENMKWIDRGKERSFSSQFPHFGEGGFQQIIACNKTMETAIIFSFFPFF